MQPNEITLAVDELNDDTTVDLVLTRFEEHLNRASYVSPSHTMATRDMLTLYRTFPKQSGNFRGVGKSTIKFSQDISVLGVDGTSSLTVPLIMEVSFSVPVGTTSAQIVEMRQRGVAILDRDDVMNPLNQQLMV
jgi:hypothetical protein